jgi:hypothetical protein
MAFDPSSLLGGYTQAELEAAFALVAPKPNWKMPIGAELPSITSIEKRNLIAFAIMFFTGGKAAFSKTAGGKIKVTAPGYYNSVGA